MNSEPEPQQKKKKKKKNENHYEDLCAHISIHGKYMYVCVYI